MGAELCKGLWRELKRDLDMINKGVNKKISKGDRAIWDSPAGDEGLVRTIMDRILDGESDWIGVVEKLWEAGGRVVVNWDDTREQRFVSGGDPRIATDVTDPDDLCGGVACKDCIVSLRRDRRRQCHHYDIGYVICRIREELRKELFRTL